jgi:hypothetical protein
MKSNVEPIGGKFKGLAHQLSELDRLFLKLERARTGASELTSEEEESDGIRSDGADIPHQYARMVSRVIEALEPLPEFKESLLGLRTLRLDLYSLDGGHHPPRLNLPPREDRSGTSNGRQAYQANVILCVRLLEEVGFSKAASRKEVADIFAAAGHRGQQGRMSPNTLTRWREDVLARESGRRYVESTIAGWKLAPQWPPSKDDALSYVKVRASNPTISLAASQ